MANVVDRETGRPSLEGGRRSCPQPASASRRATARRPLLHFLSLKGGQTVLGGVQHQLSAMPEVQLLVDVVDVIADRFWSDRKLPGHFLAAAPAGNPNQDVVLSPAEAAARRAHPTDRVPRGALHLPG